jgi:hypothetical protein
VADRVKDGGVTAPKEEDSGNSPASPAEVLVDPINNKKAREKAVRESFLFIEVKYKLEFTSILTETGKARILWVLYLVFARLGNQTFDGFFKCLNFINGKRHALLGGLFFLIFIDIPFTNVKIFSTSIFTNIDVDGFTPSFLVNGYSLFQGLILLIGF